MICGVFELEGTAQIGDKTRLDATKTFATKGEADITLVEIDPTGEGTFIDVTGESHDDWYLDWIYSGPSNVLSPVLRVTTDGAPQIFTKTINIVSADEEKLFSTDDDIKALEPDVMKYVPEGRASWIAVHRSAQSKILDTINKMGIRSTDGSLITKDQIIDIDEVRYWSRDLTLSLIFMLSQNSKDDFFAEKAKHYADEADAAKARAVLRLDFNKDGTQSVGESYDFTARDLRRE